MLHQHLQAVQILCDLAGGRVAESLGALLFDGPIGGMQCLPNRLDGKAWSRSDKDAEPKGVGAVYRTRVHHGGNEDFSRSAGLGSGETVPCHAYDLIEIVPHPKCASNHLRIS